MSADVDTDFLIVLFPTRPVVTPLDAATMVELEIATLLVPCKLPPLALLCRPVDSAFCRVKQIYYVRLDLTKFNLSVVKWYNKISRNQQILYKILKRK